MYNLTAVNNFSEDNGYFVRLSRFDLAVTNCDIPSCDLCNYCIFAIIVSVIIIKKASPDWHTVKPI